MFSPSKTFMWCYNPYSESGKLLARELDVLRIKHEGSTFYGNDSHTVINWGSSSKTWGVKGFGMKILNNPNAVGQCTNKTRFFGLCEKYKYEGAPRIPPWSILPGVAKEWLQKGMCVFARQKVEGMGGDGIVIMEKPVDFAEAMLYTVYIPKKWEYRLYMVGEKVIDASWKGRLLAETPANWKVRSRDNGFVHIPMKVEDVPDDVVLQAQKAMMITGLDYAGVDVIFGEKDKLAYVLEVNTAPWLSDETASLLAAEIKKIA